MELPANRAPPVWRHAGFVDGAAEGTAFCSGGDGMISCLKTLQAKAGVLCVVQEVDSLWRYPRFSPAGVRCNAAHPVRARPTLGYAVHCLGRAGVVPAACMLVLSFEIFMGGLWTLVRTCTVAGHWVCGIVEVSVDTNYNQYFLSSTLHTGMTCCPWC